VFQLAHNRSFQAVSCTCSKLVFS